jgi:PAS domain S-box-containing protein
MTDRRPPADARMEGERLSLLLMENVKDYAIFMLDAEGRIVSWNAGAERVLGYKEPEIIGKPFSIIFTSEEIVNKRPEQELRNAKEQGRAEDERWHVRKNGSRLWASGVVTPLFDADGSLQGYAKILRDITERKKTEEELAEANRRKDEFLAMLAHELRNPLAPIQNVLPLIKRGGQGKTALEQSVAMIERQLGRITRIVNDLLDVSRINQGKINLQREHVTLQAVVQQGIEGSRSLLESRKHELTVTLPEQAIWLDADPVRMEQVITNLLSNAAKYTEPYGKIWVYAERLGNDCILTVKDNGVGILAEMLPRIFDLFVQADQSLDRSQGGLGIGLTLVKRLVEMHGGTIEAHSEGVGHGSEFVVRLPVVPELQGLRPEEPPAQCEGPERSLRILVVDDNVDTAQSLAQLLKLYGHELHVAHTGQKALQMALAEKPDVVLLDIGLPGMDGYQVAKHIREHEELAGTRLIAVTGYGRESDQERSSQSGFNQHLVKPVDPAKLQALLAKETC